MCDHQPKLCFPSAFSLSALEKKMDDALEKKMGDAQTKFGHACFTLLKKNTSKSPDF
jgi:hypothetical protein